MSPSPQERDRWESCPSGTLVRTVRGIQARQRHRRRVQMLGLAGSVVVLLLAATMIAQQFGQGSATPPKLGKITCATVRSLLPAYLARKLDAAVASQVETHLQRCPHCRDRYEKAKEETASVRSDEQADRVPAIRYSARGVAAPVAC